jgi:biopolymer transport protein ExbD
MSVARSLKRAAAFQPSADPNVIPFIDVLLVLLIIFMVTAPKPTVDLHVNLPRAGMQHAPDAATIVDVREQNGVLVISVDGEAVVLAGLPERAFAHASANNPQSASEDILPHARVLVRADQGTAYGNVVMVVDALQQAHFGGVGIFGQNADAP